MIQIIDGDIFEAFEKGEINILAHCVNCRGVMGSGIAASIKERYPSVYEHYWDACNIDKEIGQPNLLGKHQVVPIEYGSENCIANLFGQLDYGRGKRYLNYGALACAMLGLLRYVERPDVRKTIIGFPYLIGCGLAGGDETIVMELIDQIFKYRHVKIYKLPINGGK